MIALQVYKVIHLAALFLAFATLGGLALTVANGATKETSRVRRLIAVTHGVAMFFVLLGGFGMLARLGLISGFPLWVWAKIVIWVLVGALLALPYRKPQLAKPIFFLLPVLGGLAAWFAIYKPM